MRVVVCLHVNLEKVEGFTGKYKFSSQYACFVGALSVLRIYAHPLCDNTIIHFDVCLILCIHIQALAGLGIFDHLHHRPS